MKGSQSKPCPGLFVVGTDTGVGKTVVASRIAADLRQQGLRVGVYKPAASGCERRDGSLVSDDAVSLWEAAGRPHTVDAVCPQRFAAPLAPHLAALDEGKQLDPGLLRSGIEVWTASSDVVVVEGAGGLLSPLGAHEYVADLAADLGFPLIVVVPNRIGAINQALMTLLAAKHFRGGLPVAGIVLNDVLAPGHDDPSTASNRRELEDRCEVPVLAQLLYRANAFDRRADWISLAAGR